MNRRTLLLSAASIPVLAMPILTVSAAAAANPLLEPWPDGVPPYDCIRLVHYMPAFETALAEARAEYRAIADAPAAPTFLNMIEAVERAGRTMTRVSNAFFTVASADATAEVQAIEEAAVPELTRLSNDILLDPALFARIDRLHRARATLGLDPEQERLLEETHRRFVRAGAALDAAGRQRVAAINEELAALGVQFGQKLLADQKAGSVLLTEAEVAGLPDDQKNAAARAARAESRAGYLIPATRSAVEPFLTFATDRAARAKLFTAFDRRGANGDDKDTGPIIRRMVALRIERAGLMGAATHADHVLRDTMAKTPQAAMALLMMVYRPALLRAQEEERALLALAAADGITEIAPWDWRFYAERERQRRFRLDAAALKPYFPLDGMVAALMETTKRLYGIGFVPRPDVPAYAEGVRVWEIREADGTPIGLFYADWFARPTKRPGAWMNTLRDQNGLFGETAIVVNNCNFTPPAPGERALISRDDATTLFHEFGHALHGLFSKVRYPSLSGTAVSRDFVELPSQLHEHWVGQPAILRAHARNTAGEPIPEAMLSALLAARTFNQGYLTVQQLASAILDLRLHLLATLPADFDVQAWEAAQCADLGVPRAVGMRHRLSHFSHIFDGGYSAGYYAYTWAEVMDADGFAAFEEAGDVFDPALATKLRGEILSRGNSRDPAESYIAFRGRMPDATALLHNRGLA